MSSPTPDGTGHGLLLHSSTFPAQQKRVRAQRFMEGMEAIDFFENERNMTTKNE